jgi:protein gp37
MKSVGQCPQHDFQFLTKSGHQLERVSFGDTCWLGVSIDTQQNIWRQGLLEKAKVPIRFISFEPLLTDMPGLVLNGVDWVIVGAQTGPGATKPQPRWIERIIETAGHANVPVFLKDNVCWSEPVRQWPIAYERRMSKAEGTS